MIIFFLLLGLIACLFLLLFSNMTGANFSDDEIKMAEDKFAESLHLAQMGMFNLLENDVSKSLQFVINQ